MSEQTPRYGHAPVKMKRVDGLGDVDNQGDFYWTEREGIPHIGMALPSPTDRTPANYVMNVLPVRNGPNTMGVCWGWDGNQDKPTLTPSVHCIGYWHGWIRAGEMVEA